LITSNFFNTASINKKEAVQGHDENRSYQQELIVSYGDFSILFYLATPSVKKMKHEPGRI
jgi:hypothetical protein